MSYDTMAFGLLLGFEKRRTSDEAHSEILKPSYRSLVGGVGSYCHI